MATDKQLEANRINAQKSTGPRTQQGKEASRLNALTHGMRVRAFDVLPNEDPEQFAARVDAWFEAYRPTDSVQDELVRHAAVLSWKSDRVGRHENALLSREVRDAVKRAEKARVERSGDAFARLLPGLEHITTRGHENADVSWLRSEVETSAEGCRRLLAIWKPMQYRARAGAPWSLPEEMMAIRLTFEGKIGTIEDPATIDLAVANRLLLDREPVTMHGWYDGRGSKYEKEAVRSGIRRQPKDAAEASARLTAIADREVARLEGVLGERERDGDLGADDPEIAGWIAGFDTSTAGERLRRYQASLQRELLRTLDALAKLQAREAKASKNGAIEANPADPGQEDRGFTPPVCRDAPSVCPESPPETPFEEFLSPPICANEANPAVGVQVSSGFVANRGVFPEIDLLSDDPENADWLDISCERG